ncbi:hypothetical protein ASPZODRAFT_139618 [Penicilliopsis zonata CBS 506.65]|uniref:AMP-dependent synthetase/ligase domain-containing protein n=1 Tax=Penicilliopsis zonata CBS 506.65 TaxID=1073090 RepID=A0A1L9ST71_9EURO|nr:hypothetical protein ASPZODRAFT_139618 [Penicilliopsis zonata CBS 506.65]OJJ50311.1 hypothetical protein ASPZODRAFT_139618 [Penicilliopsis zonata CBS 506.65]
MMIFEPERRVELPTSDVLSYIFGESSSYDPDGPLYIDVGNPSRSISRNQARKIVRQLIAGFRAAGLKPGDCVSIHSFNDIYYSMLVLGIVGAGGVFTGTNPSYTQRELVHHLNVAKVKFLVSEPEIIDPLLAAATELQIPQSNIWVFDVHEKLPDGMRSWTELLKVGEEDWVRFDDLETARSTTAARLFSSGTTGLPKATIITHYNLIGQIELVFECYPKPYRTSRVVALPVFHAAAVPFCHFGTMKTGELVYMMRRFELQGFLEAMQKFEATDLTVVPPMVVAIIMYPESHKRPYLRKVRAASCAAAPLDKDLQARLAALLSDGAPFTQVWGMTETCCIATMLPYPEQDTTGAVGRLIPNMEAKLIDDDGNNISAYGVPGELCVRGPTVTPGYLDNPVANSEAFDTEGWFKTGDVAYCDAITHSWYIVDRKKELIKVRGFQVAPPELEAVLLSHPQIVDAAVIGVTFPGADSELPRAYVVRRPGEEGAKLTAEAIQQYTTPLLARYKSLAGGIKFVDAIPKNASGKILKRILREDSKKDIETGMTRPKL